MGEVLTMGEVLLRLTAPNNRRIETSHYFDFYYGGSEMNVAINLSKYGHKSRFLTILPTNKVGEGAVASLRANNIDTSYVYREEGRIGIYYYEKGFSLKKPEVIYDRKNSTILSLSTKDIDWEYLFEKVDLFHVSGITMAICDELSKFTINVCKEAKKRNVLVSFDFNYREKLWTIEKAQKNYSKIMPFVDICFAGSKDLKAFFNIENTQGKLDEGYEYLVNKYNLKCIASTNREVISANKNSLTGYIYTDVLLESKTYTFEIVDRIGGGDAFVSGILHSILQNNSWQNTVNFGTASSVLKHFVPGDFTQYTAKEVEEFLITDSYDVNR